MNYDLFEVHKFESGQESQSILDKNRDLFSADCKKVFDLLMSGKKLTVKEMDVDRARISDLRKNGVLLSCELNKERYKKWFMDEAQIEFNKQLLLKKQSL